MTARPEIRLLGIESYENTRATYRWMRANAPVYFDETDGVWGVATYDDVLAVERDSVTFSNAGGTRPDTGPLPWMIDMDAPDHSKRRKLVSSGFTPARVRASADHLESLCDELLDRVCERGECDVVADLAAPLPLIVVGDMLGVAPEDRSDLLRWSDDLIASLAGEPEHIEAAAAAFTEYSAYARAMVAARREQPADDLFTVLAHAEVDGESLDDGELVFESLLLLVGGDESTRHVLSGGIEALLTNPSERAKLVADAELLPLTVEEMLRWVSPVKNMNRTVTRDVEISGVTLRTDDMVLVLYESANFDETHFEDPDQFRIDRFPNDHLSFGFGPHFCLGANLARLEISTMVERVLRRLPDVELVSTDPPPRFMGAITSLPVRFTPTEPVLASAPG